MAKKVPALGEGDWEKFRSLMRMTIRGGPGIRVVGNQGNYTIALDDFRKRMPSEGGGVGVTIYQLTGYWTDSENDPPGRSFKGRVVDFGPDPPSGPEVRIFTWRSPFSFDLPQCNPLLEENFNSDNPEHWVPCVSTTVVNPAFDPEAEPDPDNPIPEFITAPRILWLFRGLC